MSALCVQGGNFLTSVEARYSHRTKHCAGRGREQLLEVSQPSVSYGADLRS